MSTVSVRTGREGPRHDPYHFEEITVQRTSPHFSGFVTIHLGLSEWLEARDDDGALVCDTGCRPPGPVPDIHEMFRRYAGVYPEAAMEAARELRERRIRYHGCGQRHLQWVSGYPGEKFLWCSQCSSVLDATFDKSAVE